MSPAAAKLGFWSACAAFAGAIGYAVAQVLQIAGVVRAPTDAILIYATSLLIAPAFVVAMAALCYGVPSERRVFTVAGLAFATMYATYVSLNYVVQLATVIPATAEPESVRWLDQTPHSLSWNLDALGYVCMGASMLVAAPALARGWTRRLFLAHAAVTPLIAIVYFYPRFSTALLVLGTPWILTAPAALFFLALWFRQGHAAPEARGTALPLPTAHQEGNALGSVLSYGERPAGSQYG